jgi:hypothetical protein
VWSIARARDIPDLAATWIVNSVWSAILVSTSACVAPPMGIGSGAVIPTHATTAAFGAANLEGREVVQIEAAKTIYEDGRFALDAGGALTQFRDPHEHLLDLGVLPYIRPHWQRGPLSFALTMSAALASGGEGGAVAAFLDAQVGLGDRSWSIYAGSYLHACAIADGGPIVAAGQARIGAEHMLDIGTWRVGVAVEAYRQFDMIDPLDGDGEPGVTTARHGAGVKLRFELP